MLAIRASSCTTVRPIRTLPGLSGPINQRAGRPAYEISTHQLEFLRNRMRFNWSQISRMLLVSRTTLWRRIRNLESFSSRHHYTAITDSDLDELIRGLRQGFPNSGISMMLGHLRSRNFLCSVSVLGKVWFELTLFCSSIKTPRFKNDNKVQ